MAKTMVCVQCEDVVVPRRSDSAVRVAGLLLMLASLFFFWPLAIIGFLMMLLGGARTGCPQCKGSQLVPSESGAGRRVIDARLAAKMAALR